MNLDKLLLTEEQWEQIIAGIENGLTEEQIELYAKECFNYKQMYQIRSMLEYGYSKEEVSFVADPKFTYGQMEAISNAFGNGLYIDDYTSHTCDFSRELDRI